MPLKHRCYEFLLFEGCLKRGYWTFELSLVDGGEAGSLQLTRKYRQPKRQSKRTTVDSTIFPVFFHGGSNCLYIGSRLGRWDVSPGESAKNALDMRIEDGVAIAHGEGIMASSRPASVSAASTPEPKSPRGQPDSGVDEETQATEQREEKVDPATPPRAEGSGGSVGARAIHSSKKRVFRPISDAESRPAKTLKRHLMTQRESERERELDMLYDIENVDMWTDDLVK